MNVYIGKNANGLLLKCLLEVDADRIKHEFHEGECGGHLYWKTTANKILRVGYYLPTLFQYVHKMIVSCHKFQICEGKRKLLPLPLQPITVEAPFQQWGLDFIGEIHLASFTQYKWILIATNNFNKWIEAIPSRNATDSVIIKFLEDHILSRFGCPRKIITNNVVAFGSKKMIDFCHRYQIALGHSTAYYPQGNGLAESSNKSLVTIIKKFLGENKKSWHNKLVHALWADKLTTKKSIWNVPLSACLWSRCSVSYQLRGASDKIGPRNTVRRGQHGKDDQPDHTSPANKGRSLQQSSESVIEHRKVI